MKTKLLTVLFLLSLIANLGGSSAAAFASQIIPATGQLNYSARSENTAALPSLTDFIANIKNGESFSLVGVYVAGVLALPIIQQPANQPSFVSNENNVLTQFRMASQYGTIGLLAHNYLAGDHFFKILKGHDVILIYGDGKTKNFRIDDIQSYQALSPYSVYSNFIDLAAPGKKMTSTDVFNRVYGQGNVLVLQTCIKVGNESSWGRIFLIGRENIQASTVGIQAQRAIKMAAMYQAAYAKR
jgi:hypothetical protein